MPTAVDERAALVALARRFEAAVNAHDLAALDGLVAPDYIEHEGVVEAVVAHDSVRVTFEVLFAAFPDFHLDIEDILVDGDRIAMRSIQRGTQDGPLGELPPSGRAMSILGLDLVRVRDGRLAEHWGLGDTEAMARQLGWTGDPG